MIVSSNERRLVDDPSFLFCLPSLSGSGECSSSWQRTWFPLGQGLCMASILINIRATGLCLVQRSGRFWPCYFEWRCFNVTERGRTVATSAQAIHQPRRATLQQTQEKVIATSAPSSVETTDQCGGVVFTTSEGKQDLRGSYLI